MNGAYITISSVIVILVIILILYIKERRQRENYIADLKKAREDNDGYVDDLDNLLAMLTRFQEFGMSYTKAEDIKKLYNLIIEYAADLLNTDMGSLMLVDKKTNRIEIVAAKGIAENVVKTTSMSVGEGIAGRVVQEGKPIYCEDIENDVRFMRSSRVKYSSKSFIAVPLKVKNKVIGVLNINSKAKNKAFSPRDIRLINILADQAAVAIENIQLYSNMKEMYIGTIKTLAEAIDAKDPYTRGHSDRVAEIATGIAKRMRLPQKLVRNIEFAALIHDIGKIGIKDSILLKPGRLSESEYEIIKRHPQIGEQIIAPIEFLTSVAPLVLYHHEYYNGDGYVEGLKGEEIPIGARIINVADSYEAMTSDRPYHKKMPKEEALAELRNESGKQFDPRVVEVFLDMMNEEEQESESEQARIEYEE
ncbi:MAG: GAF domain-containing protein [Elusimicrobiota bacterium]|nr:GAF domain-containing protein [Elusimicrobiota bacterium]